MDDDDDDAAAAIEEEEEVGGAGILRWVSFSVTVGCLRFCRPRNRSAAIGNSGVAGVAGIGCVRNGCVSSFTASDDELEDDDDNGADRPSPVLLLLDGTDCKGADESDHPAESSSVSDISSFKSFTICFSFS